MGDLVGIVVVADLGPGVVVVVGIVGWAGALVCMVVVDLCQGAVAVGTVGWAGPAGIAG